MSNNGLRARIRVVDHEGLAARAALAAALDAAGDILHLAYVRAERFGGDIAEAARAANDISISLTKQAGALRDVLRAEIDKARETQVYRRCQLSDGGRR